MRCEHHMKGKKTCYSTCYSTAEWLVGMAGIPVCSYHHEQWLLLFIRKPLDMRGLPVVRLRAEEAKKLMELAR